MQQPMQPELETVITSAPTETMTTAAMTTGPSILDPEMPTECPLSHRVVRKASVAIVVILVLLVAATAIYALTTSGGG